MSTDIEKKLHKINQRLIRYQRLRERFLHRRGQTSMQFRKARTRTLIQLSGLVEKSGLLEPLNITLGDDLQKDYEHLQSATTLLGALTEIRGSFYGEEAEAQKMIWLERGKGILRQQ